VTAHEVHHAWQARTRGLGADPAAQAQDERDAAAYTGAVLAAWVAGEWSPDE
jgi:hypothetical protein